MPKISTPNAPPNYTSLQTFQDTINENDMAVPTPNTVLGHIALIMMKAHFTTANSGIYTDSISPRDKPKKPTAMRVITTKSAIEAVAGTAGTISTAPTIDPFDVQETIHQFIQDQQTYAAWCATNTLLKNTIFNSVCDQYISLLKYPRKKYNIVTANQLLEHM